MSFYSHAKKDDSGVTVKINYPVENGPTLVRLEVLGDKLIHVSATPENRFRDPESLVVLPQREKVEFLVHEESDRLTVETRYLRAHLIVRTGEVIFEDVQGNVLLKEQAGGGKYFEPIEVEGTRLQRDSGLEERQEPACGSELRRPAGTHQSAMNSRDSQSRSSRQ